jgi:hypothetical protein
MIVRICKEEFLRWYREEFLVNLQGKVGLGKAFMEKFFPDFQDNVTRDWTFDTSAYTRIIGMYVEQRAVAREKKQ